MKETKFINQNKEKWEKFETLSNKTNADPDELSKLFVEITDDLSYAKTHYPKRTVRVYLNNLAQNVFLQVHKFSSSKGKFAKFWKHDLPLEMFRARKVMLFVFVFFLFSMFLGVLSTNNDPRFLTVFTGDEYVDRADEAIEDGDPAAVYGDSDETSMFLQIAENNVRVSLMTFVLGIIFSIGSLIFMLYNGIMLGSFLYYFYYKGALLSVSSALWIHGAFEISCIILAGAAGVVVGNSILFPGTYTRGQSMIIGGKRGIRMVMGLMPYLIVAAVLESFVTRYYQTMPAFLNWVIIFGSLAIMVYYFVIYPYRKFRNHDFDNLKEDPIVQPEQKIRLWRIRKLNEIFTASFTITRQIFIKSGRLLTGLFLLHAAVVTSYLILTTNLFYSSDWTIIFGAILGIGEKPDYTLLAVHLVFLSISAGYIMASVGVFEKGNELTARLLAIASLKASLLIITIFAILLLTNWFLSFVLILTIPILLLAIYSLVNINSFSIGFAHGIKDYFNSVGLFAIFFLILILLHYAMHPLRFDVGYYQTVEINLNIIVYYVSDLIRYHFVPIMKWPEIIILAMYAILYLVIFHFFLPVIYVAFSLNFYSNREKEVATGLFERFGSFGKKSNVHEGESD